MFCVYLMQGRVCGESESCGEEIRASNQPVLAVRTSGIQHPTQHTAQAQPQ